MTKENRQIEHKNENRQKESNIRNLSLAGIMAAAITLMTAYICHIPIGINGGYLHFGDFVIYLAAVLLPKPYALAAAAIGGGLADLLTAPMWAPATVVIKMLIVLPFTAKTARITTGRNLTATVIAYLISGLGYFLAEYLLFGTWTVFWLAMAQTLVQSLGSGILFIAVGVALDKVHIKNKLFN